MLYGSAAPSALVSGKHLPLTASGLQRFTAAAMGWRAGKMSERRRGGGGRGDAAAEAAAATEMPAKKQKLSSDENSNPGDLSGDENVSGDAADGLRRDIHAPFPTVGSV